MKQPFIITECRTTDINQRPYLLLRVEGPTAHGDLTFYYEGFKFQTTRGKGATRLESIDHMKMIESDGRFELQAEMKPTTETSQQSTLRRIATTNSREVAETIWKTLAKIGFPLARGITE